MKLKKAGESISDVEVTNISRHGIWIFVKSREFFLPFEKFPWFKKATVEEIMEIHLLHDHHLRWEKLDIDLDMKSLENPDDYPLVYRTD